MSINKTAPIKESRFKDIVNEEYARAKRLLNPLLKGLNRSFVKIVWGNKLRKYGGYCWKHSRLIILNHKYRDNSSENNWNEENFRMTLRHEIVHLANKNGSVHDGLFHSLLKVISGHRYVGAPAFEGKEPKQKKVIKGKFYEIK